MMKEKIYPSLKAMFPYFLFACIMIITLSFKHNYHVDEIYTYGLANHITDIGMDIQLAPHTYSPASTAYTDYMAAQAPFDLSHIWSNQANDVHPPLYYCMIYLISFLFKGSASKWIAGSINIIFMLLVLWISRKLLRVLECPESFISVFTFFFMTSFGILSTITFLRMYIVLMFEVTCLTYLIVRYRNQETRRFYGLLTLLTILGALTHYYFFIYLFFISAIYCILLLCARKWFAVMKYMACMGISAVVSILAFPAMLTHIFSDNSDRGRESFQNLHAGLADYWDNLKVYFEIIHNRLFGQCLLFLLFLILFFAVYQYSTHKFKWNWNEHKAADWSFVILPSIFYFLLVCKIAVLIADRYIYPIYALVLIWGIYGIYVLFRKLFCNISECIFPVFCVMLAVISVLSWKNAYWEYFFKDYETLDATLETYSDLDCLYVSDNFTSKIFTDYVEVSSLSSVTYFQDDLSTLENMEELRSKDEYILYTVDVDATRVIDELMAICPQLYTYKQLGQKNHSTIWYVTNDFSEYAEEKIKTLSATADLSDYLSTLNDRCLSYCIQIKDGSSLYSDTGLMEQIAKLSNYEDLTLLPVATQDMSNYFAVIDNGWPSCWQTITGNDWGELSTTFGNVNYSITNNVPKLTVLSNDYNYLEFPDAGSQPDLQIVVVNRYLGSVDETASFYVDTNGTYVRKY